MSRLLIFFVALLLLFTGGAFFWIASNRTVAGPGSATETDPDYVAPPKELTEFEFTDQMGRNFNSKELDGKVWMASFFFSTCPGICVRQNQEVASIHHRFEDRDLTILSISVQPKVDTPTALLLYSKRFEADHAKWKFLTTDQDIDYVRQVGAEFFSLAAADETHTSDVVLFDHNGKEQGRYKVTDPREQTKLILKTEELLALAETQSSSDSGDASERLPTTDEEVTNTDEQPVPHAQES